MNQGGDPMYDRNIHTLLFIGYQSENLSIQNGYIIHEPFYHLSQGPRHIDKKRL